MNRTRLILIGLLSLIALAAIPAEGERPQTLPPVPVRVWEQETIARGNFGLPGKRYLHIDAAGRPHLAYGGNNLYYAHHDGAAWQVETVDDSPRAGYRVTMALDAAGRPHILYAVDNELRYATRDGDGWLIEIIPGTIDSGYYAAYLDLALAVDGAGRPHIVYLYNDDEAPPDYGELRYARRDAVGWTEERVTAARAVAEHFSLAIDRNDRPAILFSRFEEIEEGRYARRAYLARQAAGTWRADFVAEMCHEDWPQNEALEIDGDNRAHVLLEPVCDEGLVYLYETQGGWSQPSAVGGEDPEMLLDASGRPHVAYLFAPPEEPETEAVGYALLSGGVWRHERVSPPGLSYEYVTLALDGAGQPHAAAWEATPPNPPHNDDTLRLFSKGAGGWSGRTVDRAGQVGQHHALALDGDGRPRLVYFDPRSAAMRYAEQTGETWQYETIEDDLFTGWAPGVAIDGRDRVHAAYLVGAGQLRYTLRGSAGWRVETVGQARSAAGLAVDARNRPHLVFADDVGIIRYRVFDGGRWTDETIDDPPLRGDYVALALDAAGRPHVVVNDFYNDGFFVYATRRGPGDWLVETVALDGYAQLGGISVQLWNSPQAIAIDAAGAPQVALLLEDYITFRPPTYDYYVLRLRRGADAWDVTQVAELYDGPLDSLALRLDGEGRAHIALTPYLSYVYLWRETPGGWEQQRFDADWGRVGLALDGEERVFLSYQEDYDLLLRRQVDRLLDRHTVLPLVVGPD